MILVRRTLLLAWLLCPASFLGAQVGVPPSASPYGEIRPGTTFEGFGGTLAGNGGPLHAGPRNGPVMGIRALLRANSTVSLGFGAWAALTKRTVIDPTARVAEREVSEVDHHLFGVEALFQFNFTGGKTWHGIAPFAALGLGLTKATTTDDAFGYEFGTKFYFAPAVGTRMFLGERIYLRAEARGFTWKLRYPSSWAVEPTDEPGTPEAPNAVNPTGRTGQYVVAPTLAFGIGLAF
jgi:hypothetical protein